MIRRMAFLSGLVVGSGLCAWAFGSVLAYLFTGKVLTVALDRDKGLDVKLVDVNALYEVRTVVGPRAEAPGQEVM
jgi:hypothetical protein